MDVDGKAHHILHSPNNMERVLLRTAAHSPYSAPQIVGLYVMKLVQECFSVWPMSVLGGGGRSAGVSSTNVGQTENAPALIHTIQTPYMWGGVGLWAAEEMGMVDLLLNTKQHHL